MAEAPVEEDGETTNSARPHTTIRDVAALHAAVGTALGYSPWLRIDQARIDRFAAATGDQQFIHVDPLRAAATPFGGTIAHGFLTLSLIPLLSVERSGTVIDLGARMTINYGRVELLAVEEIGTEAVQVTQRCTIEIEGEPRPACVAETIVRFVLGNGSQP